MKLTAELVEAFAGMFLSSRYDEPQPTPQFHREAWALYCSDHPQCMVIAPRDHAKSTALTFDFTLASLMFRANDYVVIIGSTEENAAEAIGNISEELHENDALQQEFGPFEFTTSSKNDIIVKFADGHKFRILARGAEQRIRGKMWNGKRPNLIICHAKGTDIYDHAIGQWMKVENHPTAKEIETECVRLRIAFSEDDEYDEVVSTEHFYLVRKSMNDVPVWMQAKEIKLGYLIGDCDDKEINRLLPRNAGTNTRAISEEKATGIQCGIPPKAQRYDLHPAAEVGAGECREDIFGSPRMGFAQSHQGSTGKIRALSSEQRALRQQGEGILLRQQGMEESIGSKTEELIEIGNSEMGGQEENKKDICACDGSRLDGRSYRPPGFRDSMRASLRIESSDVDSGGEQQQRQPALAGYAGFIWRPVIFKGNAGKGIVVMIKTKSGFYKSKFGMSHNCDDM